MIRSDKGINENETGNAVGISGRVKKLSVHVIRIILMAGISLCIFALFHHVLPRLNRSEEDAEPIEIVVPLPTESPDSGESFVVSGADGSNAEAEAEAGADPEDAAEAEAAEESEAEPEELSWREKFADHFTDEIVQTANSYSSPNISITYEMIDTTVGSKEKKARYYVADIYIADISCFQTFQKERYSYDPVKMANKSGALICVNGDYNIASKSYFLVRNGEIFGVGDTTADLGVLYYDGVLETYSPGTYSIDSIIDRKPYQTWTFGPGLLDDEGKPLKYADYNTTSSLKKSHPRCGIGYYEPGHYCFITCDGRLHDYGGLNVTEFAKIFSDLGCKSAYNLDGGASATMIFMGKVIKHQTSDRDLGDLVLIKELEEPAVEDGTNG